MKSRFYLSTLHLPDRYTTAHAHGSGNHSPISSAYGNALTSPTTTNVGVAAVSSETTYDGETRHSATKTRVIRKALTLETVAASTLSSVASVLSIEASALEKI